MTLSEQEWWEVEADKGRWAGMVDPAWITSSVVALCQQIEETRDVGILPILADALQDAGCEDELLLRFLRGDVVIMIGSIDGPTRSYNCRGNKGMSGAVVASQMRKLSRLYDGIPNVIFVEWKQYQEAKRKHYRAQEQCKDYLTNSEIKQSLLIIHHPHPSFERTKTWWDYACWFTERRLYSILLRKLKELIKSNKGFAAVVESAKHERVATAPLSSGQRVIDWDDV